MTGASFAPSRAPASEKSPPRSASVNPVIVESVMLSVAPAEALNQPGNLSTAPFRRERELPAPVTERARWRYGSIAWVSVVTIDPSRMRSPPPWTTRDDARAGLGRRDRPVPRDPPADLVAGARDGRGR